MTGDPNSPAPATPPSPPSPAASVRSPPPAPPAPSAEREANKERVTGFTDNVVSIALTLLVLDLRVPSGMAHLTFYTLAVQVGPRLVSFLLSFLIVGVYWVGHHLMFENVQRVSQRTLWINNFFLLGVSLLPASAALLGSFPGQRVAVVVYGFNVLMVSMGNLLLLVEGLRYHRANELQYNHSTARVGIRRLSIASGIAVGGILLAWINPWISYALYWVAPVWFALLQFALIAR